MIEYIINLIIYYIIILLCNLQKDACTSPLPSKTNLTTAIYLILGECGAYQGYSNICVIKLFVACM